MIKARQLFLFETGPWVTVKDGDPVAYRLHSRHYSHTVYADGRRDDPTNRARRLIVGPGEKMVLITRQCDALFAWRLSLFRADGETGLECTVFRNEGDTRSSHLIRAAEDEAVRRWTVDRMFTYVDPTRVKSTNPGCCFKAAGWRICGESKVGLLVMEKRP